MIWVILVMSALTWMLAVWFVERRIEDHETRIEALEVKAGLRSRVGEGRKS